MRSINLETEVEIAGGTVRLQGAEDPISGDLRFVQYVLHGGLDGVVSDVRVSPPAFSQQTILRLASVVLSGGDLVQVTAGYGTVQFVPQQGEPRWVGEEDVRSLKIVRTRPASLLP